MRPVSLSSPPSIGWRPLLAWAACLAVMATGATRATSQQPREADEESVRETILALLPHGQPMLANVTDEYQTVRLWPNSAAFLEAKDALGRPCEGLDFREVGFRDAVASIARKAGTDIALDIRALEDLGFDLEVPVTAKCGAGSLESCLRALLDGLDLALAFRNGRFTVTTREAANADLEKIFYPVIPGVDPDGVMIMIEQLVAPESWANVGGIGAIAPAPAGLGHGLVVSQSAAVHEQIEGVLRGLDAATWNAEAVDEGVQPRFVRIYEIADDDVRAGLEETLVDLVNDCLPHGADAAAQATTIGRSLVIRSTSRPFQVMAAQIVAAVAGPLPDFEIEADIPENAGQDGPDEPEAAPDGDAQKT